MSHVRFCKRRLTRNACKNLSVCCTGLGLKTSLEQELHDSLVVLEDDIADFNGQASGMSSTRRAVIKLHVDQTAFNEGKALELAFISSLYKERCSRRR